MSTATDLNLERHRRLIDIVARLQELGYRTTPVFKDGSAEPFGDGQNYGVRSACWKKEDVTHVGVVLDKAFLIDWDGNKGDPMLLEELASAIGLESMPEPAQTGSDGKSLHFLFRWPHGHDPITYHHSQDDTFPWVDFKTGNQLMHVKLHKTLNPHLPAMEDLPIATPQMQKRMLRNAGEAHSEPADGGTGIAEWVETILRGDAGLHTSIARLAASLSVRGLFGDATQEVIEAIMKHSARRCSDPTTWQNYFDDIPRAISTAVGKFEKAVFNLDELDEIVSSLQAAPQRRHIGFNMIGIDKPPGLMGELMSAAQDRQGWDNRSMALTTAMAMMSHLAGNKYVIKTGGRTTGTNLYLLALQPTASGKGSIKQGVMSIASATDTAEFVSSSVTSETAILRRLEKHKRISLVIDEYWKQVKAAANDSGLETGIQSSMMELYTGAVETYAGRSYADSKKDIPPINNPYVTLVGLSTAERLFAEVKDVSLLDGFLNRFIVLGSNERGDATEVLDELWPEIPIALHNVLSAESRIEIPCTALEAFKALQAEQMRRIDDNGPTGPLWGRMAENSLRLAGLVAIGVNAEKPVIDEAALRWASRVVIQSLTGLTEMMDVHVNNGPFADLLSRVEKYVQRAAIGKIKSKPYEEFLRHGVVPTALVVNAVRDSWTPRAVSYLADAGVLRKLKVRGKNGKEVEVLVFLGAH